MPRINLEYRNSSLHECCKSVKSTLLGNTDYGVTDKVARNIEKETGEVMKHDVNVKILCDALNLSSKVRAVRAVCRRIDFNLLSRKRIDFSLLTYVWC